MNIRASFHKISSYLILIFKGREEYAKYVGVKIGKKCRIITTKWGTEPFLIDIGDNVTITDGVRFLTHDGSAWLARDNNGRRYLYAKISIGNNVFIGVNSIIMPGVKIEDNVIVAAGSVVTKSIRAGSVVAGVPAKLIGDYKELYQKMIDDYVTEKDMMDVGSYKDRVFGVVKNDFKPFL
ncbi:acyltransferase [Sphingobacterium sp. UGAL515B_05]|uniref:acyltransferase n=1 Tax=Sphingobacterium sp. UGAL515B_05 TaxID=2986767 RepID=UPI002954080F|nr:acyltransferase [Sphingobacterium sp. UGAL515B_05]WON96148.1 acyltransferase [Sphingobacterium sp. UGAL515B_05]